MPMVDAPTKLETRKLDGAIEAVNGSAGERADARAGNTFAENPNHPMRRATDNAGNAANAAAPNSTHNAAPRGSDIPERYQLLNEIGVGGMGIVYKVYDRDTGEVIALKILKPEIAADEDMREGLRQEVCLARKVTHKNVCRIHEFNRSTAAACISMELVEGESLAAKLHREGGLLASQAIDLARQICAGLSEAHAQGIVHRDLKPANIMVSSAGVVKIMDFGIARLSQGATQMTRTMVGTPEYMSPEQVELRGVTPRTDIYSLGLVLYEMVTGVRAFSGDSAIGVAVKQLREMPRRPAEIVAVIDARLDAAIMKCLRKEPAKRFQTIDEFDSALAEIQKPQPQAAPRGQKVRKLKAELQPAMHRGLEATKAAASHAGAFALQAGAMVDKNARRATAGLNRAAVPAFAKSLAYVRANSPAWLTPSRIRSAQVASIVGLMFFATAVTFGLVVRKGSRVASGAFASPAGTPAFSTMPPATGLSLALAPDDDSSEADADAPPSPASSPLSASADAKGDSTGEIASTPSASGAVASSKRSKARLTAKAAAANASRPVVPDRLPLAPSIASADAAPLAVQPAAAPTTLEPVKVEPATAAKPAVALSYLDVGSFKDAKWAGSAADQLTKLGYHALSVHKGVLFMQSYHVEVGPYDNAADIDATVARLAAQGYTAHVVK